MKDFPFKTLIWAVVVIIALFLFRPALMGMLANTEEMTILGNTIKVSKDESEALKASEEEYEGKISELTVMINAQDSTIQVLTDQTEDLLSDVQDCAKAKESAKSVNESITRLKRTNADVRAKSEVIDRIKILGLTPKRE